MEKYAKVMQANKAFINLIEQGKIKEAQNIQTDYIRTKMRESGILRKLVPLQENDRLDPQADSDMPTKMFELEPDSPGAVTAPLGTKPERIEIRTGKALMGFHKVMSPKHTTNITRLRTYRSDIRNILSDIDRKDIEYAEDASFLSLIDTIVGTANVAATNGNGTDILHYSTTSAITDQSLPEALKLSDRTTAKFPYTRALINSATSKEFYKWDRNEFGGDLAEEVKINGMAERKFMGINWLITVKDDIVADDVIYFFADTEYMANFEYLQDVTMFIKKEADELEWYSWEEVGLLIRNTAAVGKATFNA